MSCCMLFRTEPPLPLQHRAAAAGHTHVVQYLLVEGVDPNCRKSKAKTPLHEAAAGGHGAIIELLLAQVTSPSLSPRGALALQDCERTAQQFSSLRRTERCCRLWW